MSFTGVPAPLRDAQAPKVTVHTLAERKRTGQKITALTAVDYPSARLADEAEIDVLLVGDSLAMTVLGHPDTLAVTMEEMLHHTRAVRRGTARALLVGDMPFGSYQGSVEDAIHNAVRFIKEAGAEAVKLEGRQARAALVARIVQCDIPVVAHIGLLPQSLHAMGGYRVQGRTADAIDRLRLDAAALERAGACALVLEAVPCEVAALITKQSSIPTIGIGAGAACDGQILVLHDLVQLTFAAPAKFVRSFGDASKSFRSAFSTFRDEVLAGTFPSDAESYHVPAALRGMVEPQQG